MLILDTNIISGFFKPEPPGWLIPWLDDNDESRFYTTSITLYEILKGLHALPEGKRKHGLLENLEIFCNERINNRIIDFDRLAAEAASQITAVRRRHGLNIGTHDTMIAGIALAQRASLVTLNTKDFADLPLKIINPSSSLN